MWLLILLYLSWNAGCTWANSPPAFVRNIDLAVIKENTPIGSEVFQLEGFDPENSTLRYGLEGTDSFSVDARTGVVAVAAPLDREENDSLRFYVTLEDFVGGGQDNNLVKVPVTVIVLDENDNSPVFQKSPYRTSVKEDTPTGTTIFTGIKVTDADDVGSVLQIRCDFNPQFPDVCDKFSVVIENSTSQMSAASLVLRRTLDYSERHLYQLRLVADDGRYNASTVVSVEVEDVQNRPPLFLGSLTGIVSEDAPVGTLVMTVKAKDGDEGDPRNITYELVANPEEFFSLHPTTGELKTVKPLDREIFAWSNGVINVGVKASEVGVGEEGVSVAALSITIRDVNDEPPTFNKVSYTVHVSENVANGTPLPNLDMFVQDTDSGSNSVFHVSLVDGSGIFSVEPPLATGSTSVSVRVANGPLDYENPNQRKFILLVVAKEAFTEPQLSSTGTVTVNIVDTNDNTPQFEKSEYRATVIETSPPGTVVDTITATDRDTKSFGEAGIVYSLFGNGAERFNVGRSSGVITVAACATPGSGNCLDFETRPAYHLSLQAVDEGGRRHAAVVPLTVLLSDANDNIPAFLHDAYSATIDEGATKFDSPLRVQAVDADASSVPLYSIIAGDQERLFTIDGRSGEISVAQPMGLDVSALKTDLIVLTVQASDDGKGVTTTVKIRVKDANNNSPIFQKISYVAVVPESSPAETVVEQVWASDADTGINAALSYRIQKGGFDDFDVDSSTGVVSVAKGAKLDFDRRSQYLIEMIAVDGGSPIHTGTTTLTVHILNSNDKAPYFTPSTQRTQVTEGEPVGHLIYKLKATDPDISGPESLNYALVQPITAIDKDGRQLSEHVTGYQNFFRVDANSGEVRVASHLDRETAAIVTMTVLVTDTSASPPQTGTGTLVVTVVDLNEFPPSFGRPWTPERPELSISVTEEQPRGSAVATLVASDPDSNIAAYRIEPENPYFSIDPASGVVSVKSRVDFEAVERISFRVVAYDTGIPQLSAVALVVANIININDNDPVFNNPSYEAVLPENSPQGTTVTRVLATDSDAGDFGLIRYSLLGERSLDFSIDQQGVLRVAAAATLDRETTPSITLQVVATDQGPGARRAVSVPIYISLEDVNDNLPVFSQREYEASVVSGLPASPPPIVVQLFAEDRDEGPNAHIQFSITAGNEKGIFGINQETGVVFAAQALEEGAKSYRLRVRASNEGANAVSTDEMGADEAVVRVRVVDVNRHKPKFLAPALPNATVNVPENQSIPNFLVLVVSAEDKDRGENGRISYYLKVGDTNVEETDEFHINTVTGELRTRIILDREKTPKYQLVLAARDNGSPAAFEALRFLTVALKDVDDNSPRFPRTQTTNPYVFTLDENLPAGQAIGRVVAEDADLGENALVYYYIIDGNYGGYFQVEKTSGLIKSNVSFDREEREIFEIVIKATSDPNYTIYERAEESELSAASRSYREEDASLALVRILIADINDNAPRFLNEPYLAGVRSSAQAGDLVTTVQATDPDLGPGFGYRLESVHLFRAGAGSGVRPVPAPFAVSAEGHVTAAQLMAPFGRARFQLTLAAREAAPPHRLARTTLKLWIYEPNQLVRVIVSQPPEEVNRNKKQVHEILSNATRGAVVIDDIRYHVNEKNKLERKWTDLYIHVVNNEDEMMLISQVLEAVDSNSKLLSAHRETFKIHKIVPAYVGLLDEEFDLALMALITLLVVIFVGVITMIVCCMCLKKWYSSKMHEALVRHDEVDPGNTTENPLWTEQKLKLYEEQELSMTVSPDQHHQQQGSPPNLRQLTPPEDTESAVYATLRPGSRMGTFLPADDYATLNGCYSGQAPPLPGPESHEYHELQSRPVLNHSPAIGAGGQRTEPEPEPGDEMNPSVLTIDNDGEPVLITELL